MKIRYSLKSKTVKYITVLELLTFKRNFVLFYWTGYWGKKIHLPSLTYSRAISEDEYEKSVSESGIKCKCSKSIQFSLITV